VTSVQTSLGRPLGRGRPFATRPGPTEKLEGDQSTGPGGFILLMLVAAAPALMIWIPDTLVSLVLIGVMALAAVAASWELLIVLMFGVVFFIGPVKILNGGWAPYVIPELVTGLVLLKWAVTQMQTGGTFFKGTPLSTPFLWLVGYLLVELGNPAAPVLRSMFGLRSWLIYTVMLFVGYSVYRGADQVEKFYRVLVVIGVATALYGIYQWRQGPFALEALGGGYVRYARESGYMFWADHVVGPAFRAPGSYTSSAAFGVNMGLLIVLALGPLMSRSTPRTRRIAYGVAVLTMGVAIPCSGSRAPIAYLGGSLIVIAVLMRRYKAVIFVAPMAFLAWTLGSGVTAGRFVERYATLTDPNTYLWKWLRPLVGSISTVNEPFGRGLGYAVGVPSLLGGGGWTEFQLNTVDSGYGAVTQELGLPGLAIFTWFAITLGIQTAKAWRALSPGVTRDMFLGPAVYGIAFPVWTLIAAPHASLPSSAYFWLLIGMLLRAGVMSRDASSRDAAAFAKQSRAYTTPHGPRWRMR
jgi:hypothetical protein